MNELNGGNLRKPSSHVKQLPVDPKHPFPVGVEYYRAPTPPTRFWDEDFASIRAAGMSIVRTFTPWNWIEREPGKFDFDDYDLMFELAQKHDLQVWLDTPVGTHAACPEWMIREHPEMRVEWADGTIQQPTAFNAAPQGTMIHNFDHPKWGEYVERYIRALVPRYRDHPNMLVWGTWDGISLAAAWAGRNNEPPYNDYTIAKYINWLQSRFTLDQLNERLFRRYPSWDDVEAPRSHDAIVEMTLYRQFHYENMADHLGWLADLIDQLDGKHEQRSHGASFPRPSDEYCSPRIDGWGLSHHASDRLTSDDPYSVACECYGFQWSRAMGRNGRWWNEEIYSNFVGGLKFAEKPTIPEESTLFLWLSLIEGAAGALYWQYRPEYMTFEAPGLGLMSLDGKPTPRWTAIEKAIGDIDKINEHLPVTIPRAEMAIAYSGPSHEVFTYADQNTPFIYQQRGVYRTLWSHSIAQDLVSPSMDWSGYKVVYLPNFAVLDDTAISRLRQVLTDESGPALIADGHFGTFSGKGHWSFQPPEGLSDLIQARIVDFDFVSEKDIAGGNNILKTEHGDFPLATPCQYAILEPLGDSQAMATLQGNIVGVVAADARWKWFGVSLAATDVSPMPGQPREFPSAGVGHPDLALPLFSTYGIGPQFTFDGDRLVGFRRTSKLGGSLIFLLNLEQRSATTTVRPNWPIETVKDLLRNQQLAVTDGAFQVKLEFGEVCVLHCPDVPK